jgi:hypothetical protein
MTDNIHLRQYREPVRTAPAGPYPLSFLESKLNVTRLQVLEAIEAVGNDRIKVANYLRSKRFQ